jgi:hypothetical protein
MIKKRRTYLPCIVGTKADLKRLHKYMCEVDAHQHLL